MDSRTPIRKVVDILSTLVALNTVSGSGTRRAVSTLSEIVSQAGGAARILTSHDPNAPGVALSFYSSLKAPAPPLVFAGHIDTVPPSDAWSSNPFSLWEGDNEFYGLGVSDMKGFFAAVIAVCIEHANALRCDVHILITSDEEIGCLGAKAVDLSSISDASPFGVIVGEPTGNNLAVRHPGKANFNITCLSDGGHASNIAHVCNPFHIISDFIVSASKNNHSSASDFTFSVGAIEGGVAANVIPPRAEALFEIRYPTEAEWERALCALDDIVLNVIQRHLHLGVSEESLDLKQLTHTPSLVDTNSRSADFVSYLQENGAGNVSDIAFGTESGIFQGKIDAPTVVWGPGQISQAHQPNETLNKSDMWEFVLSVESLLLRVS